MHVYMNMEKESFSCKTCHVIHVLNSSYYAAYICGLLGLGRIPETALGAAAVS